jgi:hypothetical protein
MSLKNRQAGKVEIFVGADKLAGYAKNVIEFDTMALKTDIATATSKTALLTALGIPTYADQTAANAALAAGVVYYNTATGKVESATA